MGTNIKSFTSLRGVACLIVIMTHVWDILDLPRLLGNNLPARTLADVIAKTFNGSAAVEVFFVLSGCVLALSLRNGSAAPGTPWVARFWLRRFFRIYPALWFALLLTLCALPLIRAGASSGLYSDWGVIAYPSHLTPKIIALSLGALYVHLDWPMWTLRVELFYSLLFPAIYVFAKHPRYRPFLIGFLILIAWAPIPRALSLHYALAFGLGAIVPFSRGIEGYPYRITATGGFVLLMFARVALAHIGMNLKDMENVEIAISAIIIYCLYHNQSYMPILDKRTFEFIGDISYSAYIVHFPVVFAACSLLIRVLGADTIHRDPLASAAALAALTFAVTIPLAAFSRRYVERPGERIGKSACNALFGRRLTTAAPLPSVTEHQ